MTNPNEPTPTDYKRATALIVHHGRQDFPAIDGVIMEAANAGRPTILLCSLIDVYDEVMSRLLTGAGLIALRQAFEVMEAKNIDSHNRRAAALILAYLTEERAKVASVLEEANAAQAVKHLFFAVMDAFMVLVPILGSPGAQAEFQRSVLWQAAQEDPTTDIPEKEL